MAKAAHSDELKAAFEKHHAETEGQVERLEQVFELMEKPARGKTCPAILGLVEEGQEIMKEFKTSDAHDAGLLSGAQAVEHYEISRYGTLIAWAEQLGMRDAARFSSKIWTRKRRRTRRSPGSPKPRSMRWRPETGSYKRGGRPSRSPSCPHQFQPIDIIDTRFSLHQPEMPTISGPPGPC